MNGEMANDRRRIEPWVAVLATSMFVLSIGAAILSTLEAVEERQSAAAAMDFRLAVAEIAHSGQLHSLGGEVDVAEISAAVDVLGGNRDLALHAMGPTESAEAMVLLDEVAEHGEAFAQVEATDVHDHGDLVSLDHEHGRLIELLRAATDRSSTDASVAERNAGVALGTLSIAMAFVVWLVMRSRAKALADKASTDAQLRSGQRIETLLNDSHELLLVVDADGLVEYRSANHTELLGPFGDTLEDIVQRGSAHDRASIRAHLGHTGPTRASASFELIAANGESGWFEMRVSDLSDDELVGGRLITISDVTNETRLRDELRLQAVTDLLTGLPNRRLLEPEIERARQVMENQRSTMAMMTLDIDGFKSINDTFGHLAGDELLVKVASRLRKATQADQTLIRLGGDEFAVITPNALDAAEATRAANRFLTVLDEPFSIDGRDERVRTSIGVAITDDPAHVAHLLGEADLAMYEAKRLGGDRAVLFEESFESTYTRRDQISRALREADYDEEFRVVYQPIVDTRTHQITSVEALLRWTSSTIGEVRPDEFISLAEVSGQISSIGQWVIDQVCRQLGEWTEAGVDPNLHVSFNVSPRQLAEEPFVACVLETAAKWGVDHSRLIVEVTESVALDSTGHAKDQLERLRTAGLRISIDDFGSGYSNLGQLLAIPFDIIKIDRSLLLTLSSMREQSGGDASDSCAIMEAIVSIASILDAPVVCEGVETRDQLASLGASGISHVQGFLTGRPMSPSKLTSLLVSPRSNGGISSRPALAPVPVASNHDGTVARAS